MALRASVSARRDCSSQRARSVSRDGAECALGWRESRVTELRHGPQRPARSAPRPCRAMVFIGQLPDLRRNCPAARERTAPAPPRIPRRFPAVPVGPAPTISTPSRASQVFSPWSASPTAAAAGLAAYSAATVQGAPGSPVRRPGSQRVLAQYHGSGSRCARAAAVSSVAAGVAGRMRRSPTRARPRTGRTPSSGTRPGCTPPRAAGSPSMARSPRHDRVPHRLGASRPLLRLAGLPGLTSLLGPDLERGVQQADRLGHREGRVEEEHRRALLLQRLHDDSDHGAQP